MLCTREVTVIRLLCKGSIEEAIMQCAETKLKLEQDLNLIDGTYMTRFVVVMMLYLLYR